jgi:hypothetical protein
MAEISVGRAAGAGLRIIRREPLAVLGWAALNLAMSVALLSLFGGLIARVLAVAGQPQPDSSDFIGLQMQMVGLQPLFTLGGIVMQTLVMGAVFRAVLQPEARRWAYLRLSGQELWLGLVTVVISFGIGFGVVILIFPLAAIAAFLSLAFRESLGVWGMVSAGLVAFLIVMSAVVWLMLRLCMAYPMSFADRNFRLFESWAFTRGHVGKLFLVFLVAVLIALAIQVVAFVIGAAAVVATLGPDWKALIAGDALALFRAGGPLMAVLVVVWAVLASLTAAITTAPLADAYRQLKGADA